MTYARCILLTILFVAGLGAVVGFAQPASHNVYYQAELLDNIGNPVDTIISMEFHIYDDIAAGTSLWDETQPAVEVIAGVFSVYLGEVNTLLPSVFAGQDNRYLGVKVGDDAEMVPRSLIAAVPSAMRAGISDDVVDTAITESKLRNKSVSRGKINDKAVGRGQVDDKAIGRGQVDDKAVGRGQLDDASVGALQIEDAAIEFADIGQNSATSGQIMKWTGVAWAPADDDTGDSDGDWDIIGNAVYTAEAYGIARAGATLYGTNDSTHVNLGVGGTTGTLGPSYKYATVGGGFQNVASAEVSTVAGGENNEAGGHGSFVGSGSTNQAMGSMSVVGGGFTNLADGISSTVSGGTNNLADGLNATVGGGATNSSLANGSVIAGGSGNTIEATAYDGVIGGGQVNYIAAGATGVTIGGGVADSAYGEGASIGGGRNNWVNGDYATIGGGDSARVSGSYSTVAGGHSNETQNDAATIGGGNSNLVQGSGGTISGGWYNEIASASIRGTISGGAANTMTGNHAAIGGGRDNVVEGDSGTVAGGGFNRVYATGGTIGGGSSNSVEVTLGSTHGTVSGGRSNTASGSYATVAGGEMNEATGDNSFVAGGRLNEANGEWSFAGGFRAIAQNDGSFVWSSGNSGPITSGGSGHFVANADKFWFGDNASVTYTTNRFIETSTGAYLSTSGTWQNVSDADRKENFVPVSGEDILERIAELPISKWNYKDDPGQHQHIGPTAQDFKAVFEVGEDDKTISVIDPSGVALAGIQELYRLNRSLELEVTELKSLVRELLGGKAKVTETTQDR